LDSGKLKAMTGNDTVLFLDSIFKIRAQPLTAHYAALYHKY
jgi:hypothetical protein